MTTDYDLLWPFLVICYEVHVYISIIPLQMGLITYSFLLFIFCHTAHKRRGGLRA